MSEDNQDKPYNPLSQGSIDELLKKRAEKEKQLVLAKEEEDDYIVCINRLFSSDDGKYFLNKLKRACGLNLFDKEINPAKLIEDAGRRKVWFELIRPYLDVSIQRELEQ